MKTKLLELPWEVGYDELGGYDCMTSAYYIKCGCFILFHIDCGNYRYKHEDEKPHDRSEEAEAVANHIISLHNNGLASKEANK